MMDERSRMKKRCGEFGSAFGVGFWTGAVTLLVMIAAGIWIAMQPARYFDIQLTDTGVGVMGTATFTGFTSEFLNGGRFNMIEFGRDMLTADAMEYPKQVFLVGYFGWIPCVAAFVGVLGALRYIFRNIKRYDTPFTTQNIKALYTLGIIIIAGLYMYRTVLPLVCWTMGFGTGDFTILDFYSFFAGTPFFCLAYIFDYGCVLQKESDETL